MAANHGYAFQPEGVSSPGAGTALLNGVTSKRQSPSPASITFTFATTAAKTEPYGGHLAANSSTPSPPATIVKGRRTAHRERLLKTTPRYFQRKPMRYTPRAPDLAEHEQRRRRPADVLLKAPMTCRAGRTAAAGTLTPADASTTYSYDNLDR